MEKEKDNPDKIQNEKKSSKKLTPLWKVLILAFVVAALIMTIVIVVNTSNAANKSQSFSLKYESIMDDDTRFFLVLDVLAKDSTILSSSSFTIMIDGVPFMSGGIAESKDGVLRDSLHTWSKTIYVAFDFKLEDVKSSLNFYYGGQKLEFGKVTTF